MAGTHFSQLLQDEGTEIVELCAGQIKDGRDFYAFIQMNIESYERYQKALSQNEPLDLNAYGKILHTGWGKEPDAETADWVMKTYTENSKIREAIGKDALAIADILKSNSKESN